MQTAQDDAGGGAGSAFDGDSPSVDSTPKADATDNHDTLDTLDTHESNDPDDPKKPRACEACRGLKVKCEPDLNNLDGPCKRCAKAGRCCVITQPTRKRQKKTDSRVAELEKKIDALTATLQASRAPGPNPNATISSPVAASSLPPSSDAGYSSARHASLSDMPYGRSASASASLDQQHRSASNPYWDPPPPRQPPTQSLGHGIGIGDAILPPGMSTSTGGQKRKRPSEAPIGPNQHPAVSPAAPRPPRDPTQQVADVVDRGILSMDVATELFARYTRDMAPHLPIVIFPPEVTARQLRKNAPYLFLAVMAAAASEMPDIQRALVNEFTQMVADRVIIVGDKSLELVQAILIGVIWYFPPEHFEELKFYQYVHLGAVMAIDIGLGKRKANSKSRLIPYTWRDHPFRKGPLPDPTSIEARRTWLGCYFLASNVSMALHRPNLIRWAPFMQECLDILSTSPDAAPTDRTLCHLVWTHRVAEEIGVQFSMDDPSIHVDVSEPKVQHALKGFERDVTRYQEAIPAHEKRPSLMLAFHVISLYMHEIALYVDKPDEFRPPLNAEALRDPIPALSEALTSAHINALSSCLDAIDGIFETFMSMDANTIRCLPIFNFVRVAYAVVVLIKMYFSASSPDSELGKVFKKEDMKVQSYLDGLLEKFCETAAGDKSRPAGKFLVVLMMLSGWFRKQEGPKSGKAGDQRGSSRRGPHRSNGPGGTSGTSSNLAGQRLPQDIHQHHSSHRPGSGEWQQHQPQASIPQARQQEYPQATTPLHLLSEVATGGTPSDASRMGFQQQSQQAPAWAATQPYYHNRANGNTGSYASSNANQTPPASGTADVSGAGAGPGPGPGPGPTMMTFMPGAMLGGGSWGDLDYTGIGSGTGGLEQAMGMTLTGFGDLAGGGGGGGGGANGAIADGVADDPAALEQHMRYQMANNQIISSILDDLPVMSPGGWFQ